MALALNNLKRVDMPLNKETNQTKNLSGATTAGQSGPGNDGNKGVLYIPQNSSIIGASHQIV